MKKYINLFQQFDKIDNLTKLFYQSVYEITKKSWEINFEEFNKTICNDEHLKLSHRNLIEIYRFLYK